MLEDHLGDNNLNGTIPESLLFQSPNLITLDLSDNLFSGNLPNQFQSSSLVELYLDENVLNGTIPESLFLQNPNLRTLDLSNNLFSGSLPYSLAFALELRELRVSNTNLEGIISTLATGLNTFQFSGTNLYGTFPHEYCSQDFSDCQSGSNSILMCDCGESRSVCGRECVESKRCIDLYVFDTCSKAQDVCACVEEIDFEEMYVVSKNINVCHINHVSKHSTYTARTRIQVQERCCMWKPF